MNTYCFSAIVSVYIIQYKYASCVGQHSVRTYAHRDVRNNSLQLRQKAPRFTFSFDKVCSMNGSEEEYAGVFEVHQVSVDTG